MQRTILPLAAMLLLFGCGEGAEPSAQSQPGDDAGSTFEPLTGTLDRAAGVEDTLREAAEERRRQLEAQE